MWNSTHRYGLTVGMFVAMLMASALRPTPVAAQELTLVADGASQAPIVLYADAPPKTRAAAAELADYIEKISGARPELIEGEPAQTPEHAIWVGYQPALDGLFPEQDFEFEHPEEILIAANEDHLVIAGRDRWNPDALLVEGRGGTIQGQQLEYGTANAVYTFLQDYLDVRWLWPGELGEDIIEQKTIAFEPFAYRYHPQIRERSELLRLSELQDNRGMSFDWVRRQRLQLDSLQLGGGHAFTTWWSRFSESNPEYFALQPNGRRSGFPGPGKVKLCLSNPAVAEQWVKDVAQKLEEEPNRTVFNASPNDSHNRGICICDNCRAWDSPDGEPKRYSWEGVSQQYVAMSDRYIRFANRCGELLKERFPDKDYYVLQMAYGTAQPVPAEAEPADNVIVSHVGHFPWSQEEHAQPEKAQWKGWAAMTENMVYRPNTGNRAGWHWGLPEAPFTRAGKDMQFLAENSLKGIFIDTVWEHWSTQGPLYYVMGHLTWNPEQDINALMQDYYQRGFGPAASQVEAYWTLMERTARQHVEQGASIRDIHKTYTADLLDEAQALLDDAAAAVEGEPDKYAQRVAFVRAGFDWSRLLIENRALVERIEHSDGQDAEAAEQALANWEKLNAILEEHPQAFNEFWFRNPASNSRLTGTHPENHW